VSHDPLPFPFDNQGKFHPSRPNPDVHDYSNENEGGEHRVHQLAPRPAQGPIVIEKQRPVEIQHIFHAEEPEFLYVERQPEIIYHEPEIFYHEAMTVIEPVELFIDEPEEILVKLESRPMP